MSALRSRLAIMTTLSFLCALVFTIPVSAQSGSGGMIDLKGTGSTGSFSYDESEHKSPAHQAKHRKSEGSKSKASSLGSKDYTHHISGSKSDKAYSPHGKSKHGYSHKKSEGSKSKSYSHSPHGKSKHSYGHNKHEGSKSKSYSHGKSGHGKSHRAYKGGHGKSYGYKRSASHGGHHKSPFQHVMYYKKKLGLTGAQIQAMKSLDFEFKKKRIQAKADHQIAHMELKLHVHSGKVDESKIRAAGAKIVAAKSNKILAMIEAKIQLLNLLTEEQRQKMAKMH